MSIFTKQDMWEVAVEQLGTSSNVTRYDENGKRIPWCFGIELCCPEDVEELYTALKKAHEESVEFYERGMIG